MTDYLKPIMLGGTGSDVGKSLIATGLCRIFMQDGYCPAPFKAQNMALNSYVTPDGLEIGRAQAIQAEAAAVLCHSDMNPILLKPTGERMSQVIINGKPTGNKDAIRYFHPEIRAILRKVVTSAFDRLSAKYNPIVLEGAGSIAELNFRDDDIVNMWMADYAGADVFLVADIDKGGIFASAFGSIMLQNPKDRKRIKGIIVNKFRGDINLFQKGKNILENICEVPVIGVVPFLKDIHIDEEDSLALATKKSCASNNKVNIGVIRLPHISNFTDFNLLEKDDRINLFYSIEPQELLKADILIIPGSKTTISDLKFIKELGIVETIRLASKLGKRIFGICGGYQMLGERIDDPVGVEGPTPECEGCGLLPVKTRISADKITRQTEFRQIDPGLIGEGYEIHCGRTIYSGKPIPLNLMSDGQCEGCVNNNVYGTYIHGYFDNPEIIDWLIGPYCEQKNPGLINQKDYRQIQYDALAEKLRSYLDIEKIYSILKK